MSNLTSEPIVIALDIDDPDLKERLVESLAARPDIRLALPGEPADVMVTKAQAAPTAEPNTVLTPRELEVLTLLAEGASNKMVAKALGISVHTVKFHVSQLLDKLDATGRTDAVAHAARTGMIQL